MRSCNRQTRSWRRRRRRCQAANAALAVANADLENLLRSTDIATIFLDARGAVRGFTPDGVDVYALRPGDTGRPLTDIACRLDGLPPLATDSLAAMLRTPDAVARHPDGRWFLRRVSGARDGDGGINGALVSFVRHHRAETDRGGAATRVRPAARDRRDDARPHLRQGPRQPHGLGEPAGAGRDRQGRGGGLRLQRTPISRPTGPRASGSSRSTRTSWRRATRGSTKRH